MISLLFFLTFMNSTSKPTTIKDLINVKGLVIAHLNIRSLLSKIDYLRHVLFNKPINILCLSETWLKPEMPDSLIKIAGYTFIRLDRGVKTEERIKTGGGIGIYVEQSINFVPALDTWSSTPDIETLSIHLVPHNCRRFFITMCYRPPTGNFNLFYDIISSIFENYTIHQVSLIHYS